MINNIIGLLAFLVFLYLSRTSIPPFKFIFIPGYTGILFFTLFYHRQKVYIKVKEFLTDYSLLVVLFIIFLLSFVFSSKFFTIILIDIINALVLLSLYFILSFYIISKHDLIEFKNKFLLLLNLFALIISINGLFTLFNVFSIADISTFKRVPLESSKEFLQVDYNFALLLIFFAIISLIPSRIKSQSAFRNGIENLLLVFYSIFILLSGSRRGLIVLISIIGVFLIAQFFTLSKHESIIRKLALGVRYYLIGLFAVILITGVFIFSTSYSFKNRMLDFIGSKNLTFAKDKIALNIFRDLSIFNKALTYSEVYNKIWSPLFVPEDPDSGWGTRTHVTVYPLTGENVEIVPSNAKGYLMDHNCNVDLMGGYAYSATWLPKRSVKERDVFKASVYCYVSANCDLTMVNISSLGVEGDPGKSYDMQKKGTWQKLEFEIICKEGSVGVVLFASKFGVSDFSSINGHFIFAYPNIEINSPDISYNYFNHSIISTEIVDDVNRCAGFVFINKRETYSSFIYLNEKLFRDWKTGVSDPDKFRNIILNNIQEDTVFYKNKYDFKIDTIDDNFLSGRTSRWKFAIQIYIKEYTWRQRIFGGGFNYLNWYGLYYLKDKTKTDWPHNPILSILLYSGIFGLLLYFLLLFKALKYFIIYIQDYYLFLIFFLISLFFSFFSAGSPFDPPIMGFFMLLPFLIHSIHKRNI